MEGFTFTSSNKNARIESRVDRTGKVRTETVRRDVWTDNYAVSTNERDNSTHLYIDPAFGPRVRLDGRQARTLYTLLQKHYDTLGKTVI